LLTATSVISAGLRPAARAAAAMRAWMVSRFAAITLRSAMDTRLIAWGRAVKRGSLPPLWFFTDAARAAGRNPAEVTLVAVSKTHPKEAVLAALAAGQYVFGENKVQEAEEKFPLPGAKLHLIGGLQTNKAAQAVRVADSIDSLDRPRLADAIDHAAQSQGRLPELLVQVNIGGEAQKSGIPMAEADAFIRAMRARFGAALKGLMCIPPAEANPLPYFQRLAAMADEHGLPVRSMGMSADFEVAIAAGATHVRVGTAIFGHREAPV
jgi:pyridoxal phosphate enzyme (YggS family)